MKQKLNYIINIIFKEKLFLSKLYRYIDPKKDIFYILSLIGISISIFFYFNLTKFTLYGDDAYIDASFINFFADNFPNVNYYPFWYSGLSGFTNLRGLRHIILGLVSRFFNIDGAVTTNICLLLSLTLIPILYYLLSRALKINKKLSFCFSVLPLTTPAFWNWSIRGGAYARVFTLPLLLISII